MRKYASLWGVVLIFVVILGLISLNVPCLADRALSTIDCKDCSIMEYDSSGDLTLNTPAGNVTIPRASSPSKTGLTPLALFVDGNQWLHYGGTVILLPDGIETVDDGKPVRKDYVVILSTVDGVPVLVLQGDICSMAEIPELGMTAITVDKQKAYAYDANIDVIPVVVMEGEL